MANMKTWNTALFLLLSLQCIYSEEDVKTDEAHKEEDGVLVLTKDSFEEVVTKEKFILVEFYTPWCGHCKALAPAYTAAAKKLKTSDSAVPLAKVDCTQEKELCDAKGVSGYPTLKWYKDGESTDYDGPRDHDGIVNYILERSDPNWKPPPEAVLTLTEENFDEIIKKEELMLVEFYAPWCGHCKKIAPELEKAAKVLNKKEKPIKIGKVDATIHTNLASRFSVQGYPTMFIFRNGKEFEYKGPRNEPEISAYMENQEGPATVLQATMKDVKKFIRKPHYNIDPHILAVVDSEEDPIYQLFLNANNEVRDDYAFGHTFAKEAKKHFGLKQSAILLVQPETLRSKYEPKFHVYKDEGGSPSEVRDFYKKTRVPLVGQFTPNNEGNFDKRPLVLVFYDVSFDPEDIKTTQYWRNKVISVAREFPDMLFAIASEEHYAKRLTELGLAESGEDVNVGIYDALGRRYSLIDEEFSEETLTEFVQDFLNGKLKPTIKSESPVPKAKAGKVQVVTGNQFDELVLDESKEVFIEFYAPWCGHCKAIESYIKDLAVKYKGEKDIVIAKMDGTLNEAPSQYKFEGFPTIYYSLPGKKKEPILLDGKRDMESLVEFIESNSVVLKKKKDEL